MVPGSVLVSAFFAGSRISGACSVVSSAVSGSAMDSSGSTVSAIGGSSGIMASVVPFRASLLWRLPFLRGLLLPLVPGMLPEIRPVHS